MSVSSHSLRVAVAQIGARHHYAIPRMLEEAGCLEVFHTDSNAVMGWGRALSSLPVVRSRGGVKNLSQRLIPGVPKEKIWHTDALLKHRVLSVVGLAERRAGYIEDDYQFDEIIASRGFDGVDTLYAMQKHGTKMLEAARRAGVRTVIDVFITPLAERIVQGERVKFPDLERPLDDECQLETEDDRTRREIEHADVLLCPGWNVVDGLSSFPNVKGKRFAVVPYGCGVSFGGRKNTPVRGRVLFAGTADLRKGIHYLGMAAQQLGTENFEFRVAGNVSDSVKNHALTKNLNFLGRVPRDEMREEFLSADVFVLPTLAEGCASVVHEAVMAGCPVITTRASGTLVEEGMGGLIVPERDAEALASAIESVIGDREQRDFLAETCRELAYELSEDRWRLRLMEALNDPCLRRFGASL